MVVGTSISLLSSSFPISEVGPVTLKTQLEVDLAPWYPQGLLTELELESELTLCNLPAYDYSSDGAQVPAVLSLFPGLLFLLGILNLSRMYWLGLHAASHTSQLTSRQHTLLQPLTWVEYALDHM